MAADIRLWHALEKQLLAPFEYYGIADGVSLEAVEWRRGGYDLGGLDRVYTGNDERARLVISKLKEIHGHPEKGRGLEICVSVAHAEFMGVPRESLLDNALFGCDELAGLITACAYVRPEGIHGMKPKSVKKKLKQPSFAAAVSREDIQTGAEELGAESGLDFDAHLQVVIDAMAERADELGIGPREETAQSG